jgi:Tol biopolymer transport system component
MALSPGTRTCLAKDPDERFQSAHDLLVELRWIGEAGAEAGARTSDVARRRWREIVAWGIAGASALAAAAIGAVHFRETTPALRTIRFHVAPPLGLTSRASRDLPAISPDGQGLAFTGFLPGGTSMRWIQPLESTTARVLPGTEGATSPFWSPDSQSIAFFTGSELKRVGATGAPVQTLCDLPAVSMGGTWGRGGTIVFGTSNGPLYAVSESGGDARAITSLDRSRGDSSYRAPQFLPDGRLLYELFSTQRAGTYVSAMDFTNPRRVLASTSAARYAWPGYLLFGNQDTLMAQRFKLTTLQTIGEPVPIAEHVGQGMPGLKFSVSDTGTLSYAVPVMLNAQLAWFDRNGKRLSNVGEPGPYRQVVLSPDEKLVAVARGAPPADSDIWLRDLASGVISLFVSTQAYNPVWTPDGKRIVFSSNRKGTARLYWKAVGGGEEEVLFEAPESAYPEDVYGDGRFLLYIDANGQGFYSLPLDGERKGTLLLPRSDYSKDEPHVSPDNRWVAYGLLESGTWQVWTASFPGFRDRQQISKSGGAQARWRRDGGELYYVSLDGKMMAVKVTTGATLEIGATQALFQSTLKPDATLDQYAVTADGQRFLMAEPLEEPVKPMTVIVNWTADLPQQPR